PPASLSEPGTRHATAPRRTVRLRLTLLYVGLFLASAACLLVITYFLVAQQLPQTLTLRTSGGGTAGAPGTAGTAGAGGQLVIGGASIATACSLPSANTLPTAAQMSACQLLVQQEATRLRNDTLDQLLIESGVALGIMAVASVG